MSYARFGTDSDVYVFANVGGYLDCCGCSIDPDGRFFSTDEMITHLRKHVALGHAVPGSVFSELEEDRVDNDAFIEGASGPRELDR